MVPRISHPGAGVALAPGQLARLRTARLLSRRELAIRAGISLSALGKIENGARRPRVATLKRLCEALSCQPGDLTAAEPP